MTTNKQEIQLCNRYNTRLQYSCTRQKGHTGRHQRHRFVKTDEVLAEWESNDWSGTMDRVDEVRS